MPSTRARRPVSPCVSKRGNRRGASGGSRPDVRPSSWVAVLAHDLLSYFPVMSAVQKALKTFAVVWVALAVTIVGVSGIVICIGSDGHFAFETAHHGRCPGRPDGEGHAQHEASAPISDAATSCCGDCVDVSLSMDSMSHVAKNMRQIRLSRNVAGRSLPGSSTGVGHHDLRAPWTGPLRGHPPGLSTALCAHRTVVLRT